MTLMFFAALAGAVQMVAPDRWMPASVFVWQRGWRVWRIAGFSLLMSAVHIALGFAIYEAVARILAGVPEEFLGLFTLIFLGGVGAVRALRFSRFKEVLYRGPKASKVVFTLLSVIGPSEMVIPVLMKARLDGVRAVPLLLPLWLGTCAAGFAVLMIARARWNRPMALPGMVRWCQSRVAAVPMAAGALVGLVFMAIRVI